MASRPVSLTSILFPQYKVSLLFQHRMVYLACKILWHLSKCKFLCHINNSPQFSPSVTFCLNSKELHDCNFRTCSDG